MGGVNYNGYQRFRIPTGWDAQERMFVVQLQDVLDDLNRKLQKATDNISELRKSIEELEESDDNV